MEKSRDNKKEILLIPIGKILVEILEEIAVALRKTYKLHVRIGRSEEPGTDMYSDERRQYFAEKLMTLPLSRKRENLAAVLGVVDGDMFAGEKNFVYGIHQAGRGAAVIALARLREDFYKKSSNRELFLRRAVTEAIYQVGLAIGLTTCPQNKCVLSLSTTLWRLDAKGQAFCPVCQVRAENKINPERPMASMAAARSAQDTQSESGEGPEGEDVLVPNLQTLVGQAEKELEDENTVEADIFEPENPLAAEEAALHEETSGPDEPLVADAKIPRDE